MELKKIGVPKLTIAFEKAAELVTLRLKNGVVALIIRDSGVTAGLYPLGIEEDIPAGLGTTNVEYVQRAFTGWTNRPRQVLLAVIGPATGEGDTEGTPITAGADLLAASDFDYLAAPPDVTQAELKSIQSWLAQARKGYCIGKLVAADFAADDMAVINFCASGIRVGETTYTGAQYCSRIAGILAGTPISGSATYAQLSEVTGVDAIEDPDGAVDAGKLILLHDGRKAKLARGINSLQTISDDIPEDLRKIKIVEAVDLIRAQSRLVIEDSYIGQMPNSYDNKLLLVTQLQSFLSQLEGEGILARNSSWVELDLDKQRSWLKEQGVAVEDMTDIEVLQEDTGSWVFICMGGQVLDAMEDFRLKNWIGGN